MLRNLFGRGWAGTTEQHLPATQHLPVKNTFLEFPELDDEERKRNVGTFPLARKDEKEKEKVQKPGTAEAPPIKEEPDNAKDPEKPAAAAASSLTEQPIQEDRDKAKSPGHALEQLAAAAAALPKTAVAKNTTIEWVEEKADTRAIKSFGGIASRRYSEESVSEEPEPAGEVCSAQVAPSPPEPPALGRGPSIPAATTEWWQHPAEPPMLGRECVGQVQCWSQQRYHPGYGLGWQQPYMDPSSFQQVLLPQIQQDPYAYLDGANLPIAEHNRLRDWYKEQAELYKVQAEELKAMVNKIEEALKRKTGEAACKLDGVEEEPPDDDMEPVGVEVALQALSEDEGKELAAPPKPPVLADRKGVKSEPCSFKLGEPAFLDPPSSFATKEPAITEPFPPPPGLQAWSFPIGGEGKHADLRSDKKTDEFVDSIRTGSQGPKTGKPSSFESAMSTAASSALPDEGDPTQVLHFTPKIQQPSDFGARPDDEPEAETMFSYVSKVSPGLAVLDEWRSVTQECVKNTFIDVPDNEDMDERKIQSFPGAVPASKSPTARPQLSSVPESPEAPEQYSFTVPYGKLNSTDKSIVSKPFDVVMQGETVRFLVQITASKIEDKKGGHNFKKAKGKGKLEVNCKKTLSSGVPTQIFFVVGSQTKGPVTHNFSESSLCGLRKEEEEWDFLSEVDQATQTVTICVKMPGCRVISVA